MTNFHAENNFTFATNLILPSHKSCMVHLKISNQLLFFYGCQCDNVWCLSFLFLEVVNANIFPVWRCPSQGLSKLSLSLEISFVWHRVRKPLNLMVLSHMLMYWGFFSLQGSCSGPCTGWTCSGNESGWCIGEGCSLEYPTSLPAEVGTCVVDEAGDCRRQEPFWCSVQLHAALACGTPFLAVLQTS